MAEIINGLDGGEGGRYQDAHTLFFYIATVNTPAMALKMIAKGSQYAFGDKDNNGNFLDGSKTYKLNIPGKGWFVLLRLYGPLEPWFDKTWRPGEFEEI